MYFDAEQTYEALAETTPAVFYPVARTGKSNLVIGVIAGILIGRKWPVR